MLDMILSQAVNGLVLGFLYVLIAVGLSIIFGMLGIVNFAHGAFFAIGAYFALVLNREFGWFAALLAPIATGAVGVAVEMLLIRRLYGKEPLLGLILTFALALLFEAILRMIFGGAPVPFTAPKFLAGFVEYGPILITKYRMFVLAVTVLALVAFRAFLAYTPFGRIIRAGFARCGDGGPARHQPPHRAQRRLRHRLPTCRTCGHARRPALDRPALDGGRGDHAGLLVGITTAMTIQFYPEWAGAAMYVLMAAILLVRPRGLFGEKWERFE